MGDRMIPIGQAAAVLVESAQPARDDVWRSSEGLARIDACAELLPPPGAEVVHAATAEIRRLRAPVPIVLFCPMCRVRHIDRGEFATKAHHTHSCQSCGFTWRPAVVATVGVEFLPGFRDEPGVRPGGTCTFMLGLRACGRVAFGVGEGTTRPLCPEHGGPPPAVKPWPHGSAGGCEFVVRTEATGAGGTRGLLCGETAWSGDDETGNRCPEHGGSPAPPGATP